MRLHTLRLHAVGPFADEQVIDFDRLGAGGLFLFEGPTGVGKSTILDALTFALYGGLASDSGDAGRLRSDFAEPQVRPEVALEFSVRGERHRITRSPEHLRPKRRGTGSTRERSSVHLQRWQAGAWASRSHAKDEVGTLVTELVGLSRDQFRQVVLLPQGEFATFLRADDDQRREVLVRLFGTHFYRQVTDQLQARAHDARSALQAAEAELAARVAAAWEAAGRATDEGSAQAPGSAVAWVEWLEAVAEDLVESAGVAEATALAAEQRAAQVRDRVADAEQVVALLDRRGELQAVLERAEQERPAHEERVVRLAAARRADPVRPLVELAGELADRADEATAQATAEGADGEQLAGHGAEELADRAGALRLNATGVAHLVDVEAGLAAGQQAVAAAQAELADLQRQVETLERRAEELPAALSSARAEHDALREQASSVSACSDALDLAVQRLRAAERAAGLAESLVGLREARRSARRASEEARDHVALLTEQRLSDLRAELAGSLVSGEPCLVCGSAEHPAPAATARLGVTDGDVRTAVRHRDEVQVAREEAEVRLATAERELELVRAAAGGLTVEAARDRHDDAAATLAGAQDAGGLLSGSGARLAGLDEELREVADSRLTLAQRVATRRAEVDHAAAELSRRAVEVAAARGDHLTVAARIAALEAQAGALERRGRRVEELARALADWQRAEERAARESSKAGFASLGAARAAVLDDAQCRDLDSVVSAWQSAVARARAQLESPDLVRVAQVDRGVARAEVATLRSQQQADQGEATAARRAATVAARQRDRFADRLAEVSVVAGRRAELARDAEEVVALDQYARGLAGTPRMSLVTFVLRYWFEQVVGAANLRLGAMSAGKYQLLRVDEGARRDARVGLGLAVLDRHTGRERAPGTLSGGETFYTSLALALGLADVVIAQAGGAQLDTLFIDEGFGSLDPDTLDDVMGVIDDLRGNGRVVGIVSHVPDLKERIAERLAVRRIRPDGPSTIEVVA